MKDLKVLIYRGFHCLHLNDFEVIANSFPNLEQLKFACMCKPWAWFRGKSLPFPTVEAIDFLASELKLLKKIHISRSSHICDQSLVALSQNCIFLNAVTICGREHDVTENDIGFLFRNMPYLQDLSITATKKMNSSQSTNIYY